MDELPSDLWVYRTTTRTPTGETPFALSYGAEALAPVKILEEAPRVQFFDVSTNSDSLLPEKDLLEETREGQLL